MISKKTASMTSLVAVGLILSGCVALGVEGANISKDEIVYQANIDAAQSGDPVAQYKVGDALCCSVHEGSGFYNTQKSVEWLCLSARQGHGPAMYQVGKILSSDVIDGVRLARRLVQGVAGTSENLPVAFGWLRAASANGVPEAKERAEDVWSDMSDDERAQAVEFDGATTPDACTWAEVGFE